MIVSSSIGVVARPNRECPNEWLTDAERTILPSARTYHPAARNLAVGLAHGDDVIPTNAVRSADNGEEVKLIRRVLVDGLPWNIWFEATVPKAIGTRPTDSF